MNIKLTKKEWEFLKASALEGKGFYESMRMPAVYEARYILINKLLKKLGSEWVDDCKHGHYHKGKVPNNINYWNCDICNALIKRSELVDDE